MTEIRRSKRFGFFNLEELKVKSLPGLPSADEACEKCGLYKTVRFPRMPVTGQGDKRALILAEAPGRTEDEKNIQLIGKAGQLLRRHITTLGLNLERDFWKRNIVNCRPTDKEGENRAPTKKEVQYCRSKWQQTIDELKPSYIILMGGKAVEGFFGWRKSRIFGKDLSITRWRRLCIPDPVTNAWVLPIIHPSYALRQPDMEQIFHDDLKFALSVVKIQKDVPEFVDERRNITVLTDYTEIMSILGWANSQRFFAYDFEANCLKPHFEGAKLLTIGFSCYGNKGYSFPYEHSNIWSEKDKNSIKEAVQKILTNPNIGKIVQNRGMEEPWSMHERFLDCVPYPIIKDTMITSHVVDERDYYTGLKFQAYINWGVLDYDKEVEPYKTAQPGSLYNRLDRLPFSTICVYNGIDAMLTCRLFRLQQKLTREDATNKADTFLQEGMVDLIKMTVRGIDVNRKYYGKVTSGLNKKITTLKKEINNSPEAKLFQERTGQSFDMDSVDHLKKLFFTFMGLKPVSFTGKGNPQVNADTLLKLDSPIAKKIVKIRQTKKIADYTGLIYRLSDGDKIHPSLNLHLATTYRSSSDTPNLQNFPKRDQTANRIVRSGIIATPGWQIMTADYGGHEVRGWAWYTKDPVLVKELSEGMDPHGTWAEFLGCSRFDGKNAFVFPLIYGSYWKSIHKELVFRGYTNISEELVREAERKFWEKYNYSKEWQDRLIYDYYKKGYVETYLGFRRRGLLRRNQIVNFPIQSTCFHCLMWSYKRLGRIQEKEGWKTTQRGQIHDENLFKLWPEEFAYVGRMVEQVMVKELMEEYDWINVAPISEFAVSKIGGNWAKMYKFTQEYKQNGITIIHNNWDAIEGKTWEGDKEIVVNPGTVRPDGMRIYERGRSRLKQ